MNTGGASERGTAESPLRGGFSFPRAARAELGNAQLRANLHTVTQRIRARRADVIAELDDWEQLREAGRRIKDEVLSRLDEHLARFEATATAAGATVHWAPDAAAANAIVAGIVRGHGARDVVKMKSLTTDEIGLNDALQAEGISAVETDLAELIIQLGHDRPSHILVPAIHRNRREVRDLFARTIARGRELSDEPAELAEAARLYLRERFLAAPVGVSGANFGIAETGTVCLVESEGNGRMCTTLPPVLISVMGIEKLLPRLQDLEVFLQLLPRSSVGERMNPYTSLITGVTAGDGPRELHIVLLDNGRSAVLRDPVGRQALRCIRCSACLNICPVYARVGGHAYGSVYPGPIGAILTPQLRGIEQFATLPFASTLCGACAEVCPVMIDIPAVLLHLRGLAVARTASAAERGVFGAAAAVFGGPRRFAWAQRLGRLAQRPLLRGGVVRRLPPPLQGWTQGRDLRPVPAKTFREWWAAEHGEEAL